MCISKIWRFHLHKYNWIGHFMDIWYNIFNIDFSHSIFKKKKRKSNLCGRLMRQQVLLINFSAAVDAWSLRGSHVLPLLSPRWTARRRERPCQPSAPPRRLCSERLTWLSSPPTGCCAVTAQSALPWRKPLSLVQVSGLREEACV